MPIDVPPLPPGWPRSRPGVGRRHRPRIGPPPSVRLPSRAPFAPAGPSPILFSTTFPQAKSPDLAGLRRSKKHPLLGGVGTAGGQPAARMSGLGARIGWPYDEDLALRGWFSTGGTGVDFVAKVLSALDRSDNVAPK
jgi:hypothetical protein